MRKAWTERFLLLLSRVAVHAMPHALSYSTDQRREFVDIADLVVGQNEPAQVWASRQRLKALGQPVVGEVQLVRVGVGVMWRWRGETEVSDVTKASRPPGKSS